MISKIDLKKLIAETREIAESLDEFADKLEKIENKYEKSEKSTADPLKYSNNGFPHFMEERTEDDLEESEDDE